MQEKRRNWYEWAWYFAVFMFIYVWFTRIHPLVVFDADDWTYITYVRGALPLWGTWNPSRVFPETFMPFVCTTAVHLLMPLTSDYLGSITMASAFVVSICVTVYIRCFGQLMKRAFSLSALSAGYASALFLILHFLVFRTQESNNNYLFYCVNLTCYYYYLIPELLAAALVMHMTGNPEFEQFLAAGNPAKKGLFYLLIYLIIFSNLPASGILAVYAGSKALLYLIRQRKSFRLKAYLYDNRLCIAILLAWLISAVFELSGGRAGSANLSSSLLKGLKNAVYIFADTFFGCNVWFLVICFGSFALAICLLLLAFQKKATPEAVLLSQLSVWMLCAAVMLLYTMILSAKVSLSYMTRSEYLFGVFFFGLMTVLVCFAYIVQKYPNILLVIPILLCVLFFEVNTNGRTFQESTMQYIDAETCMQISNDLVEQAVTAEQAGLAYMTLSVPLWESEDNWPHAVVLMDRMSRALQEHGILHKPMHMVIEPDPAINSAYNLPIPEAK